MNRARLKGALSLATAVIVVLALAGAARAAAVTVNTVPALLAAVNNGAPGDVITIAPGTYDLSASPRGLDPIVDLTIQGGGTNPSQVVLLGKGINSDVAHVLAQNLTIDFTDFGGINTDGGSLVFRHGRIIDRSQFSITAVEGDFGPLTLIDVEIVGMNGVGVGLVYDGGPGPDGFGALTLVNVQIHGFGQGIRSFANDTITIIDTHVFGNTLACHMQVRGPFVTSGSIDDDGSCPFSPQNPNTSVGTGVMVSPSDLQRGGTPVTLTFDNVTQAGETTVFSLGTAGPPPPSGFQLGNQPIYYEIATTALFSGQILVCIGFNPSNFPSGTPTLVHFDSSGNPAPVTPAASPPNQVCGFVTFLSPFAVLAQSAVPFAAFTANVEIERDEFELKAAFTLGAASDGIAPTIEDVSLQVGPFSTTIPAGSFRADKKGRFKFEGVVGGVALEVEIRALSGSRFEFKAEGKGANLIEAVNPVTVRLGVGNDAGSTLVTAKLDD